MTNGLVDFVTEANMPINVIHKPSFKRLLELYSVREIKIPTTRYFMKTLDERFNVMKTKLIELLHKQKYICITCDVWSCRSQSFIGFTVHYLENFKRISFALAFRPLKRRQTYKVLGETIAAVLREFGIPIRKVRHIVTDGGSGFCKSFKVYCKDQDVIVEEIIEISGNSIESGPQHNEDNTEAEIEVNETHSVYMQNEDGEVFVSNELTLNGDSVNGNDIDDDYQPQTTDFDSFVEDHMTEQNEAEENFDEFDKLNVGEPNAIELPPQRRCASHNLNLFRTTLRRCCLQQLRLH